MDGGRRLDYLAIIAGSHLVQYWLLGSAALFLAAVLRHCLPLRLRDLVNHVFLFGKQRQFVPPQGALARFDMPKSWFTHFYVLAAVSSTLCTAAMLHVFALTDSAYDRRHSVFVAGFKWLFNEAPSATWCGRDAALLTSILFNVHCVRRLCECLLVHVFSAGAISPAVYALGVTYYAAVCATLLLGTACFGDDFCDFDAVAPLDVARRMSFFQLLGVAGYALFSHQQHAAFRTFAALRRGGKDDESKSAHKIAHGGLFEYVTSPHYLCEICLYFCFYLTLNVSHPLFWLIVTFVVINQTICAIEAHKWYKLTFGERYPKDRAILVPFVF